MKKKISLLLAAIVIAFCGFIASVLYSSYTLSTQIQEHADNMTKYYDKTITENIHPLLTRERLLPNQKRNAMQIKEMQESMMNAQTLNERMTAIQNVQRSSQVFLQSARNASGSLVEDNHLQSFARDMGEQGSIRKTIEEYNDLAGMLNAQKKSLIASLQDEPSQELPLLRFDGSVPDIGKIQLGE